MRIAKTLILVLVLAWGSAVFGAVQRPSIVPRWQGSEIGEWTMDYTNALDRANQEAHWSVLIFTGAWWCPWCQPLEEKVLKTDTWRKYATSRGLYEIMVDFPNRAGTGNFCWLWDEQYQFENGLNPTNAAAAIVDRLHLQDDFSESGGTARKATNMCVSRNWETSTTNCWTVYDPEPTTSYTGIGYPTILVLAPTGEVVGRFSPDVRDYPDAEPPVHWSDEAAFAQVTNGLEQILSSCRYVHVSVSEDCREMGSATEFNGVFAKGRQLTVRATARPGFVFAGWYADGDPYAGIPDWRTPQFTYKVGAEDLHLRARFVEAEADQIRVNCEPLQDYGWKEEMEPLHVEVDSFSKPTVTMAPLPEGMRFDADTLTVTGTPTKPGEVVTAKITAKNASNTAGETLSVVLKVRNAQSKRLPDLIYDGGYMFVPGAEVDITNVLGASTMAEIGTNKNWSVTGLPAGMSWNSSKRTITGSPTKESMSHVVTFTLREGSETVDIATVTFMTTAFPETVLEPWFDWLGVKEGSIATNKWKLTGGKACAANTKLSLTATCPPKESGASDQWVFAGWYDSETNALENGTQDWRLASSYAYYSKTNDTTVIARFVPKSADGSVEIVCEPEPEGYPADREMELPIDVVSCSKPTVTVSALPAGMRFDANRLVVYGVPTAPGVHDFQVTAKNASGGADSGSVRVTVLNYRNAELDALLGGDGLQDSYTGFIPGDAVDGWSAFEGLAGSGWTVTGLPGSMRFDPQTGRMTGAPSAPGFYTVWFKKGTTGKATTVFEVAAYPQLELRTLVLDECGSPVADPEEDFQLTGGGDYAAGKIVKLGAVAPAGYVFVGWHDEATNALATALADYRLGVSYPYEVTTAPKTVLYGVFVPTSADFLVWDDKISKAFLNFERGVSVCDQTFRDAIGSESMPVLTVSGLPSGLSLDQKTLMLTGTPTVKGIYPVTLKIKNGSGFDFLAWAFIQVYVDKPDEVDIGYPYSIQGTDPQTIGVDDPEMFALYAGDFIEPGVRCAGRSWPMIDPSGASFDYGISSISGLPTGMSCEWTGTESSERKWWVCGGPLTAGKRTVTIRGTDMFGETRTSKIQVYFRDAPAYWLKVVNGNEAAGSVIGGNCVVKPGKKITVSASVNPGYAFVGWFSDPEGLNPVQIPGSDFDFTKPEMQSFVVPRGVDGQPVVWYTIFNEL